MKNKTVNQNNIHKLAILALIILTAAVYANSLKSTFVLDDASVIVGNDFIKSWKNFPLIFTKSYLTPFKDKAVDHSFGSQETSYRPAVSLSYFMDYFVWKLNPFGYHLTNLLLHILNAVLAYFFVFLITGETQGALFTSLLFALHPVNTEAVNVISFREDLLSFLFFVSSLIFYLKLDKYAGRKRLFAYLLSLGLFLLALFSKESAMVLPLVILLYEWIFKAEQGRPFAWLRFRHLGYFLVLCFYIGVRFFFMRNLTEPTAGYPAAGLFMNILTMCRVIAVYLKYLLFPVGIHYILPGEPHLIARSPFAAEALFSLMLIVFLLLVVIKSYRKFKWEAFSIFWFFIALLPVCNIVPIPNYIAIRYLYLPALGFCLLSALVICKLVSPKSARIILIAVLLFYSAFTITRNRTWENETSLWQDMLKKYPGSFLVYYNLGLSYAKRAEIDAAAALFEKSVSLKPDYAPAYRNLGICYLSKQMFEKAVVELNKALGLGIRSADLYNDLGIAYAAMNNFRQARSMWQEALKINPKHKNAQNSLRQMDSFK